MTNTLAIFELVDRIHEHQCTLIKEAHYLGISSHRLAGLGSLITLGLEDQLAAILCSPNGAERVRLARQRYGDELPDGELNVDEMALYKSLYGTPRAAPAAESEETQNPGPQLFRADGQGSLIKVDLGSEFELDKNDPYSPNEDEVFQEESLDTEESERCLETHQRAVPVKFIEDYDPNEFGPRAHPLTTIGKFNTPSSTVFMPQTTLIKPITDIISHSNMKHIIDRSHELFGKSLSESTRVVKGTPQLPIACSATQHSMKPIDATLFLSVLYPGLYTTSLSILSEVRKRLGSKWLRDLMYKKGGAKILDVGAGGAGILAWRDVLKAEWSLIHPDYTDASQAPQGKATVVVGSDTLRHNISHLLENTTFIPRLPDYLHASDPSTVGDEESSPKRKRFDVIIASHNLMKHSEAYMRKETILKLWSLLNPDGGVLILVEKGFQSGFDCIGGAREMILNRLIASPGSTHYEKILGSSNDETIVQKEKGMIIAPCTNHSECPLYVNPGIKVPNKDLCHFSQRYVRPNFLQRIVDSKDENHEDIKFSYLAVQRGVDKRETEAVIQGQSASDAAFSGYDASVDNAGNFAIPEVRAMDENNTPQINTLSLPRLILPPLKRKGHVVLDLCTPAGQIERWVVSRSYSKQAFRDARKSSWGDLWALGAKSRTPRNLKLTNKNDSLSQNKEEECEKDEEETEPKPQPAYMAEHDMDIPDFQRTLEKFPEWGLKANKSQKKPEKKVPAWVKKMQKRKARKHYAQKDHRGVNDMI
ncbi:37S ribosomal protein S22 [Ophidiomyces ophidiicola]|uniref:37S ribosomal protein S22 n=1 Tax=Ophidiomyces ophidiicola TaxID=1387563 RepID=UPI0020C296F9|nr:37S ribosomal protein S22 [Ophidiomyces ophidiicola]KAI1924414.1 37S ribosomal protein S22 [Ophidiomyces ophidiicola]KAI1946695.1 37S ribosomal protein S22 [Ophidiomyces ophidiicola]KAI2001318.1 37S ribosomal protein S22 [Ophidiomyces ophidiicola]KAI2006370.1 37S ribosomal protein S22 [Ophidiomyces ophidiicola]KAI2024757.1 37S ribosomal protein S22 [Ophidiomyces ophidiicola]